MAGIENWQSGKEVTERMRYMLNNNLMCDVTFLCGPDQTPVKAHKYMLASSSPVFYSMFDGPMAEKGDIAIPDIEPEVFKNLLEFVYSDEILSDIGGGQLVKLLYAADKYMLDELKKSCLSDFDYEYDDLNDSDENQESIDPTTEALGESSYSSDIADFSDLSSICEKDEPYRSFKDFVFQHLPISEFFGVEDLRMKCLAFICRHGTRMFLHQDFNLISKKNLSDILKSNNLNCKEEIIYKSVIGWAKNQCSIANITPTYKNIRNVLGDILYDIRFPLIDRKFFVKYIENEELLSTKEIRELYNFYVLKKKKLAHLSLFSSASRLGKPFDMLICNTKGEQIVWGTDRHNNSLDLCADVDAILHGIYIFKPKYNFGRGNFELYITYKKGAESRTTFLPITGSVTFEKNKKIQYFELDKKKIDKNFKFSLQLNMVDEKVFFTGKSYKSKVTKNNITVTFNKTGTAYKGQIAGLKLSRYGI